MFSQHSTIYKKPAKYFYRLPDICKVIAALFLGTLVLFSSFCSEKTDEDLIKDLMKKIARCAEKKDITTLMTFIAGDFMDDQGRGKSETGAMIKQHFTDYRGIAINVLSTRIDEIIGGSASIQTDVALSSGAAKLLRKLVNISTDNYRIKIKLIKTIGDWKIQYGEWKSIGLHELFPESMSILERIF